MQSSDITLTHAIDGFILAKRADGLAENTARIYRWALGWLLDWHGAERPLSSLTPDAVQRFFVYLEIEYRTPRGGRLSSSSRQAAWVAMRSFSAWCAADLQLPLVVPSKPRGQSPEVVPFTEAELHRLLRAAERTQAKGEKRSFSARRPTARRDTALLMVMLDTGLRIGEVCRLQVRDVDVERGQLLVAPYGTGRKTKRRVVYLGRQALRAVWRHVSDLPPEPAGLLFTTSAGKALTATAVDHLLRNLGDAAGVAHVHPHRFRHTFAVEYLRNGGDVFTLQRLLGHSSLEMVRRYLALADADAATAHQRASPADRWRL